MKKAVNVSEEQVNNSVDLSLQQAFGARVRIEGVHDILFHRWNAEDVQAKAEAKKGSEEKKRDNPEAYVYRNDEGYICIPGRYIVRSVVEAGRNFQDPRSKRKMAKDLVRMGV